MSLRPSSQSSSSSSYRNDLNTTASASNSPSTPNSSLLSSSSRSSSSRTPIIDTRNQYKGYAFVFATDENHEKETVFGKEVGSSIRYIKPIPRSQSVGDLSPIGLPFFFTGFSWKDIGGLDRSMSRGTLCIAWQVAFNRLMYYASFQEEGCLGISDEDTTWSKGEFAKWNDLFCELDGTIGKLNACEIAHLIPHFSPSLDLASLAEPNLRPETQVPINLLASTFLCAAREIMARDLGQINRLKEDVRGIENGTQGWEPCTGYTVFQASSWNAD